MLLVLQYLNIQFFICNNHSSLNSTSNKLVLSDQIKSTFQWVGARSALVDFEHSYGYNTNQYLSRRGNRSSGWYNNIQGHITYNTPVGVQ